MIQGPMSRKTFDARRFGALIAQLPGLVTPKAMRQALGATEGEFEALVRDGVLTPQIKSASVKLQWRMEEARALLSDLHDKAVTIAQEDAGWESIQSASRRSGVRRKELIAAIRSGVIEIAVQDGETGYHAFRVRSAKIDALLVSGRIARPPTAPLAGEMSAAQFGISIGMKDKARFVALIEAGHVSALNTIHPTTRRQQWRMRASDIAAFHDTFATPLTLRARFGLSRNTRVLLDKLLTMAGIGRFSPDGQDFGDLWLRAEVDPVLLQAGYCAFNHKGARARKDGKINK